MQDYICQIYHTTDKGSITLRVQTAGKSDLKNTCARGDTLGLMPPSRSICAIVHAILSSLVTRIEYKRNNQRCNPYGKNEINICKRKFDNFKVSPPKIAARKRPSGFNASLHCQKIIKQLFELQMNKEYHALPYISKEIQIKKILQNFLNSIKKQKNKNKEDCYHPRHEP